MESDQSGASRTQPTRLEVSGVSVAFGGVRALSDVSLAVPGGRVHGLIGPNGAGKTTLFDVTSGVRRPDDGTVAIDGRDVTSWTAVQRARAGLRRTFQSVQVFGWLSVVDNVVAALDWEGGGGGIAADLAAAPSRRRRDRRRREVAMESLQRCGLEHLAEESAAALPIGLGRMVELARATVSRPGVLLLDEPTSGLDGDEARNLAHYVRGVAEECGTAVLVVEHDMPFTMGLCDEIVVLDAGRVISSGLPDAVRANEAVRAAYLGVVL